VSGALPAAERTPSRERRPSRRRACARSERWKQPCPPRRDAPYGASCSRMRNWRDLAFQLLVLLGGIALSMMSRGNPKAERIASPSAGEDGSCSTRRFISEHVNPFRVLALPGSVEILHSLPSESHPLRCTSCPDALETKFRRFAGNPRRPLHVQCHRNSSPLPSQKADVRVRLWLHPANFTPGASQQASIGSMASSTGRPLDRRVACTGLPGRLIFGQ